MSTQPWTPPNGEHRPIYIGTLSKATGYSVHTIRWYEAQGLIPGVDRDRSGRRTYISDHISWLEFLAQLKLTGMSIADMRDYAQLVTNGKKSLPNRLVTLKQHRQKVLNELEARQRALDLVDKKIDYYESWLQAGKRPPEVPRLSPSQKKNRG